MLCSILSVLSLLCVIFLGCDAQETPASLTSAAVDVSASPICGEESERMEDPDALAEPPSEGAVTMTLPAIEQACSWFSVPASFSVTKEEPRVFVLHPMPHVPYCVTVMRRTGYLTLSKEEGTVTREDDVFTWCLERENRYPDDEGPYNGSILPVYLTVRSLTPESSFWIALKRSE
jgi:hypothetical protein